MGTLVKFELRKILGNRVGMAACGLAFALLVLLSVMNLNTAVLRDWDTGEVMRGFEAQQVLKQSVQSHAGVFAGEYQSGAAAIALPTRRGKRALPAAKVAAALLFAAAYWCVMTLVPLAVNAAVCGSDGWGLPVQLIFDFGNPYPLAVGQAVLLMCGVSFLVTMGVPARTLAGGVPAKVIKEL